MRLKALLPAELTPEQRTLYETLNAGPRGPAHVTADGSLEGPFNTWLHHPVVGDRLQRVGVALRYEGLIPPVARELAILVVAAAHRAEFEWHAHAAIARSLGVSDNELDAIRAGGRPRLEDPLEQEAVDVTRLLVELGDLDDDAYERAVEMLGVPALVELTTLVGYYAALALQLRLFRVPLPAGAASAFDATED